VAAEAFWADIDLDLTGAHLYQLSLGACRVRSVQFGGTTFTGAAWFTRATFTGAALFTGDTAFGGARVAPGRHVILPTGWITRAALPAEGEEEGWLYVVRDEDSSEQPRRSAG